jgi:hypothetical protein
MLKTGVKFGVPVRGLLLLGSLVLLPAWARAADMSFDGGSGCSDPPIFSQQFFLPPANATGGLCRAFGNHSGTNFDSLKFTTAFPNANPRDTFLCSADPFFLSCDFIVDGTIFHSGDLISPGPTNTITVEFFGLDRPGPGATHNGIPVVPACPPTIECGPGDNFFINLNNPVCDANGGNCRQPFSDTAAGDWLVNGSPLVFSGAANGVPEPGTWMLLLGGIGALLARARLARNGPRR